MVYEWYNMFRKKQKQKNNKKKTKKKKKKKQDTDMYALSPVGI